jgi:beta-galactosidase
VEPETASVLARYEMDFYRGKAALTVNEMGDGRVYYLAADAEDRFLAAFYGALARSLGLRRAVAAALPEGVSAHLREGESGRYLFLLNFAQAPRAVRLGKEPWHDAVTGAARSGRIVLPGLGYIVLKQGGP